MDKNIENIIDKLVELYINLNAGSLASSFPKNIIRNKFLEKKESIQSLLNFFNCSKENFNVDCLIIKKLYNSEESLSPYSNDLSIQLFKNLNFDNYKIMHYCSHIYLDKDKDFYFSFEELDYSDLEKVFPDNHHYDIDFYCNNTNKNQDPHIIIYKHFEPYFQKELSKNSNLYINLFTIVCYACEIFDFMKKNLFELGDDKFKEIFINKDLLSLQEEDFFFIELTYNDFSIRNRVNKIKNLINDLNEFKKDNSANCLSIQNKYKTISDSYINENRSILKHKI